jgi:hypothetical protein
MLCQIFQKNVGTVYRQMSFSLPIGFQSTTENKKKRKWAHDDPSFGTRHHIEAFLRTLGLSNVKTPEYISALDKIRPSIEQHLITLSENELPDGAAFRIPEYDYLGISMNKENLKGKSQTIEYIGNVLEIEPCRKQQDQLSCYLPYLYPYWYASSKNASFVYAEGRSTHYKRLSIDDMKHFRFLKLSTTMIDLKRKFDWDALMTTPQDVIDALNAIQDYESLHGFMTQVTNPEADRLIPIDSTFMNMFIKKCKKLELVMTFEQFNATKNLIIDSTGALTDTILRSSNWHKIILKILQRNGMMHLTEEMRGLITCVAYFEILTPLGMRFWTLYYVKVVMQGVQLETLPQYGNGKPLLKVLKKYCMNPKITEMEKTEINRINPNVKWKYIRDCKQSYDTLSEHTVNKSNCGIMNYALTTQILGFMRRWFLNGTTSNINKLFGVWFGGVGLRNFENVYAQMMENYGTVYRESTPGTDLIFATCVNLLLFHLFPQNTPVGYYLGQCIVASKYGTGLKYSSMNAELTLARSANIRNIGIVRKLTFTDSGHETSPETEDEADAEQPSSKKSYQDADADDYLGGKGKNRRRRTRRNPKHNTRRNTRRNTKK